MRKLFITISMLLFFLPILSENVSAHPGRTDSNGGHYCRTNCAKWGLKTGEYHYHNGSGSSTGSSSNTNSTKSTPKPNPTPTYSQADIDEGKSLGKSNGYDDGYKRNTKNSTSDTGNEGFKKGYVEGYEAGYNDGLKKIQEEDTTDGNISGKKDGKNALRNGQNKDILINNSKSTTWNNAYKAAFIKAYDYEYILQSSEQSGYDLGYSLDELLIPTEFSSDETLQNAFKTNYKTGYDKRINEENDNHLKLGTENGYALAASAMNSLDDRFIDSYKQGYEAGKSKRKEEVVAEGYQSAFINLKYQDDTNYDNKELIEWYKEGFESNDIASKIKETAFDNGHTNAKYMIPEEFKVNNESIALYKSLFQEGQELRKQEKQKQIMIASGIAIPLGGLTVGGLLIKRRKRKIA